VFERSVVVAVALLGDDDVLDSFVLEAELLRIAVFWPFELCNANSIKGSGKN